MKKLNILLIGSGGREHALAAALSRSNSCKTLYATPGNPGIFSVAEYADVDANDFAAIASFCKSHTIDLVVIGPDQALADGMSDVLSDKGIVVFGPTKAAARIEWSKDYAKQLMQRYSIPTAAYKTFTASNIADAEDYIKRSSLPIVLKADGLALGKGVVICTSHAEAIEVLREMFRGSFGTAGSTVVIEEFLQGDEASVFAICDGKRFISLAPAQDHKRIGDGDSGKNTGGMGSYAPAPIITNELLHKIETEVIEPLLSGMNADSNPFIGCLFCGLMIRDNEVKVVEFNARFGDPETQSVLSIFRGDFAWLCYSAATKNLEPGAVEHIADGVACTVVMASGGYPDTFEKGFEIRGIEEAEKVAYVYHAGTKSIDDKIISNGGRVLGVTAVAPTLGEAIRKSYAAVDLIEYDNKYYRRDIGAKGLARTSNSEL